MNPNPTSVIEAFEAKHGGPEAAVRSWNYDRDRPGNWILYPDGASREVNPMGAMIDPPNNVLMSPYHGNQDRLDLEVLDRRIRYWDAKIQNLTRDHTRLRDSMMGNDYSDAQLKQLTAIADEAKESRQQLEDLRAERSKNPIVKAHEERRQAEAERDRRIADKAATLKQLRI